MRASVGSPRGPPFMIWLFFWCGFDLGRALPAVLCPWSRFASSFRAWPLCVCGFVVSVFLPARLLVSFCCCRAPFCGWLGPSVSVSFVWLLSAPLPADCCFPSPCGWSRVAPWPSLHAGPSLWVSGCFCDGLVALLYCWECGCALSSLLHVVSWQQRPLALCGVVFPLHHDACVVRVPSITTLRYSSMMIQAPHWTPLSFTIAIL